MRILLTTALGTPHLLPLANRWAASGHDVTVIMDRSTGRFGPAGEYADRRLKLYSLDSGHPTASFDTNKQTSNLTLNEFGVPVFPLTMSDVPRWASEVDAIVLGGYSPRVSRAVLRVGPQQRAPTVMLAERPDPRTRPPKRILRDQLIERAVRRTDAVWAMSSLGRRTFAGFGAEVPILAPYPLPSVSRPCFERRDADRETDAASIVVVGRLDERKNPLVASETLRILRSRGFRFQATFCGTGPLQEPLQAAVRDMPVTLRGQTDPTETQRILRRADVLLHPSQYDGWGMVVAEAIAAGVGVVASDQTDAALELSSETVSAVPISAVRFADEVMKVFARTRVPSGIDALLATQRVAQALAGPEVLAVRTLSDLQARSGRH